MGMVCKKCGEDLTGKGIIAWVDHPCNTTTVEYRSFKHDGEFREAMIEIGMPRMAFDAFGFTPPTEMERIIYEDNSKYKDNTDETF